MDMQKAHYKKVNPLKIRPIIEQKLQMAEYRLLWWAAVTAMSLVVVAVEVWEQAKVNMII